ncbi:MAG: FtsX-like permease family protein [Promethearchaeota archaeon]
MSKIISNNIRRSKKSLGFFVKSNIILLILNFAIQDIWVYTNAIISNQDLSENKLIFTYSIVYNINSYLTFLIIFCLSLTIVITITSINYYIEKKKRDIGILKTVGANCNTIQKIFVSSFASAFTIIFIISIIVSIPMILILINEPLSLLISSLSFKIFYLFLVIFTMYFSINIKIKLMFKSTVVKLISHDYNPTFLRIRKKSLMMRLINKLGVITKLSYTNLLTKKHDLSKNMAIFTLSSLISGMIFTNAFVINTTFTSSLDAAMGGDNKENIALIGHEDIVNFIIGAYQGFSSLESIAPNNPDLTDKKHFFSIETLNSLVINDNTINIDPRITIIDKITEIQGIQVLSGMNTYKIWGKNRETKAVIFGARLERVFNDWNVEQNLSFGIANKSIVVGDSIAGTIIENIEFQKIEINNTRFSINNVVLDPIYNGFCIYINEEQLSKILNIPDNSYNTLFLTLNASNSIDRQAIINELNENIKNVLGENFTAVLMEPIFENVISSLHGMLNYHLIIGSLIATLFIFFLNEFHNFTIFHKIKELKIMRAIGVKPSGITRYIFNEFLMIMAVSISLAFSISAIFSGLFLISNPKLPAIILPISIFIAIFTFFCTVDYILVKLKFKIGKWRFYYQLTQEY